MKLKTFGILFSGILLYSGDLARAEKAGKMVANFEFENPGKSERDIGDGWKAEAGTLSEEQKHGGEYSLKLTISPQAKTHATAECSLDPSLFSPGEEVDLSAYVMCTGHMKTPSTARFTLWFTDSSGKSAGDMLIELPMEPTGGWEQVSCFGTVPAEFSSDWHVKMTAVIFVNAEPDEPGAIYLDDIKVVTKPPAKK